MDNLCLAVTEPAEASTMKEKADVVRSVYFEQDEILRGIMKHARIFHSYFLVLERGGKKPSNAQHNRPASAGPG